MDKIYDRSAFSKDRNELIESAYPNNAVELDVSDLAKINNYYNVADKGLDLTVKSASNVILINSAGEQVKELAFHANQNSRNSFSFEI